MSEVTWLLVFAIIYIFLQLIAVVSDVNLMLKSNLNYFTQPIHSLPVSQILVSLKWTG